MFECGGKYQCVCKFFFISKKLSKYTLNVSEQTSENLFGAGENSINLERRRNEKEGRQKKNFTWRIARTALKTHTQDWQFEGFMPFHTLFGMFVSFMFVVHNIRMFEKDEFMLDRASSFDYSHRSIFRRIIKNTLGPLGLSLSFCHPI